MPLSVGARMQAPTETRSGRGLVRFSALPRRLASAATHAGLAGRVRLGTRRARPVGRRSGGPADVWLVVSHRDAGHQPLGQPFPWLVHGGARGPTPEFPGYVVGPA